MGRNAQNPTYLSRETELQQLREKGLVKYRATYCGPTLLLLLTGLPYEELRGQINRRRNKIKRNKRKISTAVKGLERNTMEYMLKKHGMKPIKRELRGVTLKTFCDDMVHVKDKLVIISGCHYLLFVPSERKIYDTFQTEGCPFDQHPFAKTRMEAYWTIKHDGTLHIEHTLKARFIEKKATEPRIAKARPDLKQKRFEHAKAMLAKAMTREKRATTQRKKWAIKVKRYEKILEPNQ